MSVAAPEVRDLGAEPLDDAIRVGLAQRFRPGAVADVDLAERIAGGPPRQLLELDPDDRLADRRAAEVDRAGLTDDDRGLRRQQAAIGLVDRARDAVEARRDVHHGRAREALRLGRGPLRQLVEREVDLHAGAAVAEVLRRLPDGRRRLVLAQQLPVELLRRDARDHRSCGRDDLAVPQPDATRAGRRRRAPARRRRRCAARRHARARPPPAPRRDARRRRSARACRRSWIAQPMTWVMKPETACSGPRPVCSTQGASRPWARSDSKVDSSQSRALTSALPANASRPRRPKLPYALRARSRPCSRPELGRQHAEARVGRGHELLELAPPGRAVAGRVTIELGDVVLERRRQERCSAIGEERAGRQVGVEVLEAVTRQVVAQLGVGRRAREERMPGGHQLVREARRGELGGRVDGAAEAVVPLQHADAPALAREQRRARQGVDAGTHEDRVKARHGEEDTTRRAPVRIVDRREPARVRPRRVGSPSCAPRGR